MLSIIIAEDHPVTREGLRSLLEHRMECSIVASTGDGLRVCPLLEEHTADVLILDLDLPGLNGLDVLRKIQPMDLPTRVLVFSAREHPFYLQKARRLGASGYVLKGEPVETVVEAAQAAARGDTHFTDETLAVSGQPATGPDPQEALTEREREVLQLTAEGYTCAEIGERLGISPRTAEKHRERLREKLQAKNVVELASYVYRRGLLPGHTGRTEPLS